MIFFWISAWSPSAAVEFLTCSLTRPNSSTRALICVKLNPIPIAPSNFAAVFLMLEIVDLFHVAFAYLETNLVDKLRNRHEQSPSFHSRFDRSVLTVPLKADGILLISRKAIFHRGAHNHGKHGSRR